MHLIKGVQVIEVLLVEDNPGDIRLTIEGLKEAKMVNKIHVARDGEEAIQFLKKQSPFEKAEMPDIILLDLNLPKLDGKEVLEIIKKDKTLKKIPVVILSSSEAEVDIVKTYNLHANCYVVKPVDFEKFMYVVKSINEFWLSVVKLPPHEE